MSIRGLADYATRETRDLVFAKLSADQLPELVGRTSDWPLGSLRPQLENLITSKSTGMKLTLIPAGTFSMGISAADVRAALQADSNFTEEYAKDEQPQHSVRITQPFYMGVYEVTQGEYESVMGRNPGHFSKTGSGSSTVSGLDTTKFPAETVSWYDAIEFCNKLSMKDGFPTYYMLTEVQRENGSITSAVVSVANDNDQWAVEIGTAARKILEDRGIDLAKLKGRELHGYRLPTEAEWEYACRGGSTTMWHTGNTLASLNEAGWWGAYSTPAGNSEKRTNRVGQKSANTFGLYDMHGNVCEWCFDVYDESVYGKRSGTTSDPTVRTGSEYRVLRGGSWSDSDWGTRSALRDWLPPVDRNLYLGFRVVCSGVRTP